MLRTAALANIIIRKWVGVNVDKDSIIKTCAIHDIAKPMNFDLVKQAQFGMSEKDIGKLKQLQKKLKTKYGDDEHRASALIAKDLGCNSNVIKFVNNLEWEYLPRLFKANDLDSLISIYCDMRIGPEGILTLQERLEELKKRTGRTNYQENGARLETLITENVTLDLNQISNEQLNQKFENLLNLEILLWNHTKTKEVPDIIY